MKDKGWFAKNIYKKRRIYTVLFLSYILVILGIFIYYRNMSGRTYVTRGSFTGADKGELVISAERSKEWTETSTAGFDKGMEYDFGDEHTLVVSPDPKTSVIPAMRQKDLRSGDDLRGGAVAGEYRLYYRVDFR